MAASQSSSLKNFSEIVITAAGIAAAVSCLYYQRASRQRGAASDGCDSNNSIRKTLPADLQAWRLTSGDEGVDYALWKGLHEFFRGHGYTFWLSVQDSYMGLVSTADVASNGFGYAPLTRGMGERSPFLKLYRFSYPNPSCQAAQASDGRSVIIRVLAIGQQGRQHIEILKLVGRGPYSLISWNHTIPLMELIDFEDITFGVFPKIGGLFRHAYDAWAENSVGDILDMIMQCLEGLGFLHELYIAHRDAFKDNFLVQWHPESVKPPSYPVSRPRVFLNDFETAVIFTSDTPPEERVCVGFPLGPSFPDITRYRRPVPPEVETGKPYDPFKLDVWQFAISIQNFKSTIPEIDHTLELLRDPDASLRPSAYEALGRIAVVVGSIPPGALCIPPEIPYHDYQIEAPTYPPPAHTTTSTPPSSV